MSSLDTPNPTHGTLVEEPVEGSSNPVESESEAAIAEAATPEASSDITPPEIAPPKSPPETSPDALLAHEQFEELDPLIPLADLIHGLTDYEKQRMNPETGQVLTVEQIKVDMPLELRVSVDDAGQVTLKGTAPTQRTETNVLPVFHQMQLRIVEDRHGQ